MYYSAASWAFDFEDGTTLPSLRPGSTDSGSTTSGSSFCIVCIWIIFDGVIVPPQQGAKFPGTKLKNGDAMAHKIKNGQKLLAEIRKLCVCVCVLGGKSPRPFCFDLRKICFQGVAKLYLSFRSSHFPCRRAKTPEPKIVKKGQKPTIFFFCPSMVQSHGLII